MKIQETNSETAIALALACLGWTLGEQARAERFLALTGLTPEDLRSRLDDPSLLAAVLRFLEAHEPDLLACAETLETPASALVDARRDLER